jgi:hypothetical protein
MKFQGRTAHRQTIIVINPIFINKMTIIIKRNEKRGRKKDAIRKYFAVEDKVSICNYCNKKFSSATTLALKGHLAGDGFHKIQKTTACPNVPEHIKQYYIDHMKTRKLNKTSKCVLLEISDMNNSNNNTNNSNINEKCDIADNSKDISNAIHNNNIPTNSPPHHQKEKDFDETTNIIPDIFASSSFLPFDSNTPYDLTSGFFYGHKTYDNTTFSVIDESDFKYLNYFDTNNVNLIDNNVEESEKDSDADKKIFS